MRKLVRRMIGGSWDGAWVMLKDVPEKSVLLVSPIDVTAKYDGGKLVDNNPGMSLGPEYVSTKR
eukprot:1301378-Karenia_brevis.AAC.1